MVGVNRVYACSWVCLYRGGRGIYGRGAGAGNRSMKGGESPRERVHGSIQGIHVCLYM